MSEAFDADTGEVLPLPEYRPPETRSGAILSSSDTAEVWGALLIAQGEMEPPQRTKSATVKGRTKEGVSYEYKYSYAPLDEVIRVARKPLAAAGLGYQQFLAQRAAQHVVRTIIFHKSGQWTSVDYPIFYDASRGAQGFASGVTYARRYGLTLALGLAPADEDDDANIADAQQATVDHATSVRARPVSRANPAVAESGPVRSEARNAYRVIQAAIDAAQTAETLREIYDPTDRKWGTPFVREIEQITGVSPDSLNLLRERLAKRLEAVAGVDVFGLSRAPAEAQLQPGAAAAQQTLSEPARDPPTPDPTPPPTPSTVPAEGPSLLYPERGTESGASQRKAPRSRTERINE